MALHDKLGTAKCVTTAFGKLIPENEAYSYCLRTIAAFSAASSTSFSFVPFFGTRR